MPAIHAGLRESRLREGDADGLITVAFLGHQRIEKGYHLIPEIVRQLLGHPLKLLIHNSAPPVDCSISQQLRALASENPRVVFVENRGDQFHWQDLLDRSDSISPGAVQVWRQRRLVRASQRAVANFEILAK
jgi:hypothetical protein